MVDKVIMRNSTKDQLNQIKGIQEFSRKLRTREHEKQQQIEEVINKKLPIDYQYYSTEDEAGLSDYEVTAEDLYPRAHKEMPLTDRPRPRSFKK